MAGKQFIKTCPICSVSFIRSTPDAVNCSVRCYNIAQRRKSEKRFFDKLDRRDPDACWLWMGRTDKDGYGKHGGKQTRAHRLAWIFAYGPIPDGLSVLHKCDTPQCANHTHLFLGTKADNAADRDAKGRTARQCGHQHGMAKLTEAEAIQIRDSEGLQREIAARFGIASTMVSRIKSGVRWKHLAQGL